MSVIAEERACLDLVLEKYWYCNAHRLAVVKTAPGESALQTSAGHIGRIVNDADSPALS